MAAALFGQIDQMRACRFEWKSRENVSYLILLDISSQTIGCEQDHGIGKHIYRKEVWLDFLRYAYSARDDRFHSLKVGTLGILKGQGAVADKFVYVRVVNGELGRIDCLAPYKRGYRRRYRGRDDLHRPRLRP